MSNDIDGTELFDRRSKNNPPRGIWSSFWVMNNAKANRGLRREREGVGGPVRARSAPPTNLVPSTPLFVPSTKRVPQGSKSPVTHYLYAARLVRRTKGHPRGYIFLEIPQFAGTQAGRITSLSHPVLICYASRSKLPTERRMPNEFFRPQVHVGWIVGLLIAVAGQLIVMYSKISELEATKTQAHEFSDRELDQIQDQLKDLRNTRCPTK